MRKQNYLKTSDKRKKIGNKEKRIGHRFEKNRSTLKHIG